MIDNASILLSVIGIGYALMRAFVLDSTLPWFGRPRTRPLPRDRR